MARWATVVEIAGVIFSGCRAEMLDGKGLMSNYSGSVDWGNDYSPSVQTFNRGKKGVPFGIQFVSMEIEDLQDMVDAIKTAQAAGNSFRVKITDGIFSGTNALDLNATPDYNVDWLQTGSHSEGWVTNVILRFISQGAYS